MQIRFQNSFVRMENQQGQFYSLSKACNEVWPQRTVLLFLYFNNRATIMFFKKKKSSIVANEKKQTSQTYI